jgi:NhaP-type Na+/H+ or K+/H+ antiporter
METSVFAFSMLFAISKRVTDYALSKQQGPGMCVMWIVTSLLVWALVPDINFLFALAVGACVTPTDPVLSNSIVKGKFADTNIPRDLQRIIIAESGANDGLGYPFLFLPLYLIKYVGHPELAGHHGASKAIGLWFGETWGYTILLSVVYGAVVGYLAKELLHWAEEKKYVDRESFLVFAITLAVSMSYHHLLSIANFDSSSSLAL